MRHFFFGGVNPAPHKESTRRKPITRLEHMPSQVILPLEDTAIPLVKPGDRVAVGQPISKAQGAAVPCHASVSGRVTAIEERPHPWGGKNMAVVIESDGMDTPWDCQLDPLAPDQINLEVLLSRVHEAGIVGMGGGAYPTAEKLRQAAGKVDTLIVNAAECVDHFSVVAAQLANDTMTAYDRNNLMLFIRARWGKDRSPNLLAKLGSETLILQGF